MQLRPANTNRDAAEHDEPGELECLRCRRRAEQKGHMGASRCPTCGGPLIRPIREIEAEASRRLYGGRSVSRI